jgi:hypothetical protein
MIQEKKKDSLLSPSLFSSIHLVWLWREGSLWIRETAVLVLNWTGIFKSCKWNCSNVPYDWKSNGISQ